MSWHRHDARASAKLDRSFHARTIHAAVIDAIIHFGLMDETMQIGVVRIFAEDVVSNRGHRIIAAGVVSPLQFSERVRTAGVEGDRRGRWSQCPRRRSLGRLALECQLISKYGIPLQ